MDGNAPRDDSPTQSLGAFRVPATRPWWERVSALLLGCIVVTSVVAAVLAALGGADLFRPVVPIPGLAGIAVCLCLAFMASVAAGLRDYADARVRESETRHRGYVQHETYVLQQGQTDLRREVAMLRSEMLALLGGLPAGVVAYGDDREDAGEERALRQLSVAGNETAARGTARVPHLRSVDGG